VWWEPAKPKARAQLILNEGTKRGRKEGRKKRSESILGRPGFRIKERGSSSRSTGKFEEEADFGLNLPLGFVSFRSISLGHRS